MKKKSTNTIKLNAFVILGAILFFIVIIARISYLSLSKNVDEINLPKSPIVSEWAALFFYHIHKQKYNY